MHGEAPPPALRHWAPPERRIPTSSAPLGEATPSSAVFPALPPEVPGRTYRSKGLIFLLVLAAGCGVLAFVVPWFTIHSSIGSWSYSPLQNMFAAYVGVLDDIGGGWFLLLMSLALVAYWTRAPAVCAMGVVAMIPTLVTLAALSAGCFFAPALLPQSWVPTRFHRSVPQVAGGYGAILSLVSSVVLLVWFIVVLIHSVRLRRSTQLDGQPTSR
jgi:hypothetical protein